MFGVPISAVAAGRVLYLFCKRQYGDITKATQDITMPLPDHRVRDILRDLQKVEENIHSLCREIEKSLRRHQCSHYFCTGQVVRVTCPVVCPSHYSNLWVKADGPMPIRGEIGEIDYDDGTKILWLMETDHVPVMLNVPLIGVQVVDYDTEEYESAYPSEWDDK